MSSSRPTTRRRADRLLGRTLGKWVVERKIGRGGMGDVYVARHTELGKPAAIKVLAHHFAKSPEYVRRFRSEAIATARLNHPNVVNIYDVESAGDLHYIVMEFVDGASLHELLEERGRLHPYVAVRVARETAKALQAAHRQGIVHRDIKPGNILLNTRDARPGEGFRVVLTDFGLCQDPDADPNLVKPGFMMGTPYYVSPEQARGERADDRSDLYSLGITLYVMLTGRRPFEGRSPATVLRKQLNDPAPPLVQVSPDVPLMLTRVLNKLLHKAREKRYQISAELIRDFDKFLANNPPLRVARPAGGADRPAVARYRRR